jgi:hypothetical protein
MIKTRLIVGLITHIVIYLHVTKPVREATAPALGCSAIDDDAFSSVLPFFLQYPVNADLISS